MRALLVFGAAWLWGALPSHPSTPQGPAASAGDFALHIEVVCGDTIDTATETLRRQTMSNGEVVARVPMTPARLQALSQLVGAARLSEYPSYYNPPFEGGFAVAPEDVAANVARAAATGVAGLSIEDSTSDPAEPLFPFELAVQRVRAARRALDASGTGVLAHRQLQLVANRVEGWRMDAQLIDYHIEMLE